MTTLVSDLFRPTSDRIVLFQSSGVSDLNIMLGFHTILIQVIFNFSGIHCPGRGLTCFVDVSGFDLSSSVDY